MESAQDFNQHNEETRQNSEELEQNENEAEANYSAFFGKGSEEEQLRLREIASKLNIRDNDAIWIIVFIFNYFGRFYCQLPQKIKVSVQGNSLRLRGKSQKRRSDYFAN